MSKGVVIEIAEQSILVMTPDGRFEQVAKLGRICQLGEEISYVNTYKKPLSRWRIPRPYALAAASIFCIMIFAVLSIFGEGGSTNKVAAYVTMDINPSIEVGIDKNEYVVEVRGINDHGVELLKGITFDGLSLEAFSDLIVDRIEQGHYLDSGKANIIIASTVLDAAEKGYELELSEKVKIKFVEAINKTHTAPSVNIVVTAITAPKEVRDEAIAQGVSTGKKAVQLLTRNNQKSTSDEELKGKPIQQMIQENGGIAEIIPTERNVTKDEFKSILEEIKAEKEDRKKSKAEIKANVSKKDNDNKDENNSSNKADDSNKAKENIKNETNNKDENKKEDSHNGIDKKNEDSNENVKINVREEKDLKAEQRKEELKNMKKDQQKKKEELKNAKDDERKKQNDNIGTIERNIQTRGNDNLEDRNDQENKNDREEQKDQKERSIREERDSRQDRDPNWSIWGK